VRILHIAPEYPPGPVHGMGRYVSELAVRQAVRGDQVRVLTGDGPTGVTRENVRLLRIRSEYPFFGYHDSLQQVLEKLARGLVHPVRILEPAFGDLCLCLPEKEAQPCGFALVCTGKLA